MIEAMLHTAAMSKGYITQEFSKPRLGDNRRLCKEAAVTMVDKIIQMDYYF
jgi:hypothetical protein